MTLFKSKAAIIALGCAVVAGIAVGCSGGSTPKDPVHSENVGGIGLNLELAEGITVDTVHYVITQGTATVLEGDIAVADAAATVSVLVGGLAPGSYEIALSATSTNGEVTCAGSAPFTISTNTTTSVTVDLQCTNEDEDGVLIANGQISSCTLDVIQYYTAAPLQTSTNGSIALTSAADDVDGVQPDFSWTTTGLSTITNGTSPTATFNCNGDSGVHVVTLTVSTETNAAIPGQPPVPCEQVVTFDVNCVALSCGNGVVDTGETCDPNDPATQVGCPADCTLPVCGDGDLEGTEVCDDGNTFNNDNCPNDCTPAICGDNQVEGAEDCEPPNTATCDATCQAIAPAVCGNGIVETGEQCDPPNGTTCSSTCQIITPAVCGDGIVSGSETCEPGREANCGSQCTAVASATCFGCQSTNPNTSLFITPHICDFFSDTQLATGGPAAGLKSQQLLCWELHQCIYATECAENGTAVCYIGNNPTSPNGDCKPQVEAACESTDPGTVGARFSNYAFGCAGALDLADQTRLNCSAECFVDPNLPVNQ